MEVILTGNDLEVIDRISDVGAFSSLAIPPADLLILSWRYVSRTPGTAFVRPLDGLYDGKIVLVLEPEDEFTAEDFVAVDVEGLILSCASTQDFAYCIASVCRGSRWVDPAVRLLLGHNHHLAPHWEDLSVREQEVARLAASGLSNKRIARELDLSDGTVKMHMHHILAKLRLGSRVELAQGLADQRPIRRQTNGGSHSDPGASTAATIMLQGAQ
jgi:DNA-binding NarL/FixJ family response regulator